MASRYFDPARTPPASVNTGAAADGKYLLDLAPASGLGGGIKQTINTIPGKTYHVSFAMGTSRERGKNGSASLTVTVTDSAGSTAHAFNMTAENPGIVWERKSFGFVAHAGETTFTFSTLDDPATSFVNLDDVRVSDCCEDSSLKITPTVTVEWQCGTLQSAASVGGPYTDVPGATSPYTTPLTGGMRYFRTR